MELTRSELIDIAEAVAIRVLEKQGKQGTISQRQAVVLYGKEFLNAVKNGEIKPVSVGKGGNGTKRYALSEIQALQAFRKREARIQLGKL